MASEKAREREVLKYYQTWLESSVGFKQSQLLSLSDRFHPDGSLLKQSRDKALIAFAQLGALRLNVKRGLITLISSTHIYILAESTKTLSLVSDTQHVPGDELWFGNASMPRSQGVSEHALDPAPYVAHAANGSTYAAPALVVPDIAEDERFRNREYAGAGGISFYAGVPIMSAKGYAIGVYTVHDNHPRPGLSAEELNFMVDMASTVSDHLENLRSDAARYRGEKMVLGLGCFVEGLSTVDGRFGSPTNPRPGWASDSRSNSQMSDGDVKVQQFKGMDITTANPGSLRQEWTSAESDAIMGPEDLSAVSPAEVKSSFVTAGQTDAYRPASIPTESESSDQTRKVHPSLVHASETDEASSLPLELRQIFARAANIMRECTGSDGVVFMDCVTTNDGKGFSTSHPTARPPLQKQHSDSSTTGGGSSDDSIDRRADAGNHNSSDSGGGAQESFTAAHVRSSRRKNCARLGYSLNVSARSTASASTLSTLSISEHNMRRFIRRYPHGKIFYYSKDGDVSTSEGEKPPTARKRQSPRQDQSPAQKLSTKVLAGELLKVVPGARNVVFLPLWDFNRERWSSAAFIWTRRAGQLLNAQDDLSYLKAFGNSIMSEVSRLDAVAADRAKTSFIANISHELRSPLHGILGSIEFLQETACDAFQSSMMTSIETCGKTLLDTVNHVLDYAKINQLSRSIERKQSRNDKVRGEATGDGHKFSTNTLDADFDLATVVEEVVEAVYAGQTFRPTGSSDEEEALPPMAAATPPTRDLAETKRNTQRAATKFAGAVRLILDIERIPDYRVHGQPGAIRRLVMNILGNALKYTNKGSIHVSLRSTRPRPSPSSSLSFCLTVTDTGRGMSADFVRNHAFTAFTQEDSFATGTGLGLSIVQQIVNSLNGKIDLQSQKGKGTQIKIWLTLAPPRKQVLDLSGDLLRLVMDETPGLRLCIIDLAFISGKDEPPTNKSTNQVEKSLVSLAKDWFGMEIVTGPSMEKVATDFLAYAEPPPIEYLLHHHGQPTEDKEVPLMLMTTNAFESASLRANGMHRLTELGRVIEVISQPCGPQKLAKALYRCLRRLDQLAGDPHAQSSSTPASLQIADNPVVSPSHADVNHAPEPVEEASVRGPATPHPEVRGVKVVTRLLEGEPSANGSPNLKSPRPTLPPRNTTFSSSSIHGSDNDIDDERLPILLVDDNDINLKLLVTFMRKAGYPHHSTKDGQQALDAYKQANTSDQPFRYILMDVSMPVMDGITATRAIRAYEKAQKIQPPVVIIALTGLATENTKNDAFQAGIDYFLPKPVRFKDLLTLLRG